MIYPCEFLLVNRDWMAKGDCVCCRLESRIKRIVNRMASCVKIWWASADNNICLSNDYFCRIKKMDHLILWRNSCRAEAVMVPCDETNLVAPPIPLPWPVTRWLLPPTVDKFDTLFSEVNCRLPNVGAGRDLLSRPTPKVALLSAFSAEVA